MERLAQNYSSLVSLTITIIRHLLIYEYSSGLICLSIYFIDAHIDIVVMLVL